MTQTTTKHPHITSREDIGNGVPIIEGTRIHVRDIAGYYKMGYSSDRIARALPHLSLAQIFDALSYYHDNKEEIEVEIEANKEEHFKNNISV